MHVDPLSIALAIGGSLLGGLFGGGGGQQQNNGVVTMPALDQNQQRISNALAQVLLGGLGGGHLQAYPGSFVPAMNPALQLANATLADLIGNPARLQAPMPQYQAAPIAPTVENALTSALSGQPAFTVNPQVTEAFYKNAIEAPALKTFREQVLPETREQFASTPGMFWSSARQQAESKAASDLASSLAAQRGQLMYSDEQARRQALTDAAQRQAGVLPSAMQYALTGAMQPFQAALASREQQWQELMGNTQTALNAAQTAGQLGQQQAALEQQGLQMQYQDWLRTQAENNPYLQLALSYLGIPLIAAYQPAYQPSPWAQLLGVGGNILAGMAQAGAFNGLFG